MAFATTAACSAKRSRKPRSIRLSSQLGRWPSGIVRHDDVEVREDRGRDARPVTSPRTGSPGEAGRRLRAASGKRFDSDGWTSASTSGTRRPMSASRAQVGVSVVLPTPPFGAGDGELDHRFPCRFRSVFRHTESRGKVSGYSFNSRQAPDLRTPADALDLLVQGAAGIPEPLGSLFDRQPSSPSIRHSCCWTGVNRHGAADVDARVVAFDGISPVLLGSDIVGQQVGQRSGPRRAVEPASSDSASFSGAFVGLPRGSDR